MIKNTQKGYAILFTVVIIGIITAITIGLSNTTYKSILLSSVATDSQVAFYQADTATECALYVDVNLNLFNNWENSVTSVACGPNGYVLNMVQLSTLPLGVIGEYEMKPDISVLNSSVPCFTADVRKLDNGTTSIKGRGYNMCNASVGGTNSIRAVEREIEIDY